MKKVFSIFAVAMLGVLLWTCTKEKQGFLDNDSSKFSEDLLFYESFGTTAIGNPSVGSYNGYSREGKGAAQVEYEASGTVSVRTTSASWGYVGASGSGNAMMAAGGATLVVQNIASCGAENITISFGSNQSSDTLSLAFSVDSGANWTPIIYSKSSATWGFVSKVAVKLPVGTTCFALRFIAAASQFGTRIDDLIIRTTDPTGKAATCVPWVLLNENFGTTATGNPLVAVYEGYSKTGKGAANVVYEAASGTVSVRTTSPSSGYPGASQSCNAMMAAAGGALVVKNIASCGAENILLSFGSNESSDILSLAYSADNGANWTPVSYTKDTGWDLVSVDFTLPAGTTCFALKFTATSTSYGTRVDDITVKTNDEIGTAVSCGS